VREIRAKQRFASHQRQHAAAVVVQEIDGSAGGVFGHAFDLVVVRPAVPAIEIALVFDEKIRGDRMEVAGQHARANVGKQPTAHGAIGERPSPVPLLQGLFRTRIAKLFGVLRKHWFRKFSAAIQRTQNILRRKVHEHVVDI
jgi:hypothetical protein